MVYKVIGLMSGSSLDGLDIAHVQIEEVRGKWAFNVLNAECVPYTEKWQLDLRHAEHLSGSDFVKLNTHFGRFLGDSVNAFIARHELAHQVHFVASHGHTVFHDPASHTTFQLGDGATIAATTSLPVISDLRAMDVALGGQGAPIVPVGDKLLFEGYDYLLNIGGIANVTINSQDNGTPVAFDVCPANQVLNVLANREGKTMDEGGVMAAEGSLLPNVLDELDSDPYYKLPPPKSLSNEAARDMSFPKLFEAEHASIDMLHTFSVHIARQVRIALKQFPTSKGRANMLVTGGGAFNEFLVQQLTKELEPLSVSIIVPDPQVVKFKEAIVMALIGVLRWREETNVLSSVTGASRDSVGGAIWLG